MTEQRFQYRKRYGLHAMMKLRLNCVPPCLFQYRKRYGLHAITKNEKCIHVRGSFNTASGMDCMQSVQPSINMLKKHRFNTASGMDCMQFRGYRDCRGGQSEFQYRKRYGLHAILSPRSLGNSEPRSRFSDTDPLFAFFPKCAELFCREKCFERGLKPVIARALLSTKEI